MAEDVTRDPEDAERAAALVLTSPTTTGPIPMPEVQAGDAEAGELLSALRDEERA